MGTVQYDSIRIRSHCTSHGWSNWSTFEDGNEGENEGAFPFEILLAFIIIIVVIAAGLWLYKRKR